MYIWRGKKESEKVLRREAVKERLNLVREKRGMEAKVSWYMRSKKSRTALREEKIDKKI